jgi:hypothetical protein
VVEDRLAIPSSPSQIMRRTEGKSSSLFHADTIISNSRKETLMPFLSSALTPRFLVVLLAVLVVLILLTILFLPHMHLGFPHMLVQSTEGILD